MKKLTRAVFPGSFDPITFGHIDIVRRSLKIFDQIIIAVLSNPDKKTLFSDDQRVALIQEEFKDLVDQVKVEKFSGLLAEFVIAKDTNIIIRGLRAVSDYEYEAQMALTNKTLDEKVETLFLVTSINNSYISSSIVRQVASFGGSVSSMVPEHVAKALKLKFTK